MVVFTGRGIRGLVLEGDRPLSGYTDNLDEGEGRDGATLATPYRDCTTPVKGH
ncbi:MAG: hypothetical protein KME06_03070 [Kastovskya adunca ATA6-11-RM4]|nr:hypothetical protein [Kastovskya adunca ATA6-11-RM4]